MNIMLKYLVKSPLFLLVMTVMTYISSRVAKILGKITNTESNAFNRISQSPVYLFNPFQSQTLVVLFDVDSER